MAFVEENPAPIVRNEKYAMTEQEVLELAKALDKRSLSGESLKDTTPYKSASAAHNARDRYRAKLVQHGFLSESNKRAFSSNTRAATEEVDGKETEVFYIYLKVDKGVLTIPKDGKKA